MNAVYACLAQGKRAMLDNFFSPRSVAVIGASARPGKVGFSVINNLVRYGFSGRIYPINPEAGEILGVKAYPRITRVRAQIDLAVIVVPAPSVLPVLDDCAKKGIKAAIVISAGFKETGHEGALLEKELARRAKRLGIRLVGPNCLGIIDTKSRLNASFAQGMPPAGRIAFFSQSGALCTAVLDRALGTGLGFSKFVSLGNEADLGESEFLRYFTSDPNTSVVLGYIEGVKDGSAFLREAQRLTKRKPLILLKAGGTAAGARAASSHTGSLAGSDKAYRAAMTQAGILPATGINELMDLALAFAFQPLPAGPNLAILTNAGGPGIIAADAGERLGLRLASLQRSTVNQLREELPSTASVNDPVDVLGDAPADRYCRALERVLKDENVQAVLVILTPQAMTEPEATAKGIGQLVKSRSKPVLASFMGKVSVEAAENVLKLNGIPNYDEPPAAVRAFKAMVDYRAWQSRPKARQPSIFRDKEQALALVKKAMEKRLAHLADDDARQLIAAYGFAIPITYLAHTSRQAEEAAEKIGFPVALKVSSPHILHKTDVGGVRLGLGDKEEVAQAFQAITINARRYLPKATITGVNVQQMVTKGKEVILGITRDRDFGPMIMFGLGGIYVEVLKDISFRIVPITELEAQEMIREVRSYPLLAGVRGEEPADIPALVMALLRLSQLALDVEDISEGEVNPLLVRPQGQGCVAVDARFSLREKRQ